MKCKIDLVNDSSAPDIPTIFEFQRWVDTALTDATTPAELVIRIVDNDEMAQLNQQFRDKSGPTNVLSFPYGDLPQADDLNILGDLVICAPIITQEAQAQHKTTSAHWAHIVVHGILHLRGYDHVTDEEAEQMEGLEIAILEGLGIANPYLIVNDD